MAGIKIRSAPPVRVFQGESERLVAPRDDDQVDMIRHQAITEHDELMQPAVLTEKLKVDEALGVAIEDVLPRIPALRNV